MSEEQFICYNCNQWFETRCWFEPPIRCAHCNSADVLSAEEYSKNEAINKREEDLEDQRLFENEL